MKTAAIYVRKSIQTSKGESIQNQIDMCKQYAKDRNIVVKDSLIYCDEGYSGKDINRPRFKQMLNDLNKNHFDFLLCYRLDRVSRSLSDFSNLINLLNKHEISFISIKEQFDTSTAMGKSMMYIASVFSELERETISERISDNLSRLARSGRWLGGNCPTGFESEVSTILDSDLNKKKVYKLSPVESELVTIKELYDNLLRFKSLYELERYCIKNNLKSKNNNPFTQTSLKQILVNPIYCIADEHLYDYLNSKDFTITNKKGEFNAEFGVLLYRVNKENIISLGLHRGTIKSEDWISAQMIISKNNKIPSRQGTSSIGLLSGLVYCSICSSLMRVKYGRKTKSGVSYYYLCIVKEKNKDDCKSINLKGICIDDIIFKEVKSLIKFEALTSYLLGYLTLDKERIGKLKASDTPYGVLAINDNLTTLNKRLQILKFQLEHNIDSSSCTYISQQIELINRKIFEKRQLSFENTYSPKKSVYDLNLSALTFNEKQYLINKIIDSLYWDNRKITINFI